MRYFLFIVFSCLLIETLHSQVVFESLCSSEVRASGFTSLNGNDEFEIDLYEGKFLPDEAITCKRKRDWLILMYE